MPNPMEDGNPYKSSDEILRRIMESNFALDDTSSSASTPVNPEVAFTQVSPQSSVPQLSQNNSAQPSLTPAPYNAPLDNQLASNIWESIDTMGVTSVPNSPMSSTPSPTPPMPSTPSVPTTPMPSTTAVEATSISNINQVAPPAPTQVNQMPDTVYFPSGQNYIQTIPDPDIDDTLHGMRPIAPVSNIPPSPEPKVNYDRELEKMISPKELKRGYNLRLFKVFLRDVAVIVVCASILAFILKGFIFSPFAVPSGSMENTLQVGDNIIANKAALWGGIHRGDIVVFKDAEHWLPDSIASKDREDSAANPINSFLKFVGLMPEDDSSFLVKRVIGLPGDHIVAEGGDKPLRINDVEIDSEPYIKSFGNFSQIQFDITVPEGKLWVMGDNRGNSADSRYHMTESSKGFVSKDNVVGIVDWIISPLSRFGGIDSDVSRLRDIPNQ